jgi:hypothetical protein
MDLDATIPNVIYCKVALDQDFLLDGEVKSGLLKILYIIKETIHKNQEQEIIEGKSLYEIIFGKIS